MSLSEEERRAIVLYRIEKSKAALDDIHKVFQYCSHFYYNNKNLLSDKWLVISGQLLICLPLEGKVPSLSEADEVSAACL